MYPNKEEKLYIIGDVHGCFNTLLALIDKLPNKHPTLVFVGDLVDRGPHSAHVLDWVINNNHLCVKGNHEAVMADALSNSNVSPVTKNLWLKNGGDTTLLSYRDFDKKVLKDHLDWIKQLPNYLEFNIPDENGKTLFITHGFALPYFSKKNEKDIAVKLRNNKLKKMIATERVQEHYKYEENFLDYPIFNIFGHELCKNVIIKDSYAAIDTGCVFGDYLTALEWPSKRIFQQRMM